MSQLLLRSWSNLSFRKKGLLVGAVPVLILVLGYGSYMNHLNREQNSRAWVTHSEAVRWNLNSLLLDFFAMESAARGYALSDGGTHQLEFAAKKRDALERMQQSEKMVADNPLQHARAVELRQLGEAKISAMEALIAAASGPAGTDMRPLLDRSTAAMTRFRTSLSTLEREELRLQGERAGIMREEEKTVKTQSNLTPALTILGLAAALIVFIYPIRHRLRRLRENAAAMRQDSPLIPEEPVHDEIGEVQTELERTSEVMTERTERLRASDSEMRTILDNTGAVVFLKDLESRFVLLNRAYEKASGIDREMALGKGPLELFGAEAGAAIRANDLAVIESRAPGQFEESFTVQGERRVYLAVKVPLVDAEGAIYGICGVASDITGLKDAAQATDDHLQQRLTVLAAQLKESDQRQHDADALAAAREPERHDDAVGDVTGKIAHDFNNILASIVGYSMLLAERDGGAEPVDGAIAGILRSSQRAVQLTGQLLAMSRLAELKVLPADDVLRDVAKALRAVVGDEAALQINPSEGLGRLQVDLAQIQQLLLNLVVNAREAAPGKKVYLQANKVTLPRGEGRAVAGEFVSISVRDEGPGISSDIQLHMYEPFFTTKAPEDGAGLGLAISTIFAQRNKGWLACKSALHFGSTFTLFLPVVDLPLSPSPAVAPHEHAPVIGQKRVLVVEDEPAVGQLLASLLCHLGYKPTLAANGQIAERLLGEMGEVDLVLTDEQMPLMGGWELIDRLHQSRPGLKVIMISGTDYSTAPPGARAQPIGFLSKPFAMSALADKVQDALAA